MVLFYTMYYRRKILLSLLKSFGGELSKIDLQKLLLVFSKYQKKPSYHFIPYKYGCYSFQANADLNTLEKYNLTFSDDNKWCLIDQNELNIELVKEDREILKTVVCQFKNKLGNQLIQYTYLKYPYYAFNSQLLNKLLDREKADLVLKSKPANNLNGLYTIGYEGISFEEYLNKLIKYDIKILCDVRKNALSMKFGFSKNQMKNACENLGITYMHFPELGIRSEDRKELSNQNDYDKLFKNYITNTIPETLDSQQKLVELIEEHERVAITCFEADICKCHRLHLANAVKNLKTFSYKIYHI